MVERLTRRGALAAGSAALLAGCGAGDDPPPGRAADRRGGESSLADAALLNDALAAERRAAPLLPRSREHARLLERDIRDLRGEVRPLADAAAPPASAERAGEELIAMYVDMLAKLSEPRLRGRVGSLLAAAAEGAAQARASAGGDPAPRAFEAGRGPA